MIEAAFGQGEVVVGGRVEPDTYVVAKIPMQVLEERIGVKSHKIVAGAHGDVTVELRPEEGAAAGAPAGTTVLDVARLAVAVEDHYGAPTDVEWCFDEQRRAALRAGPPDHGASAAAAARPARASGKVLVRGLGAAPGVATGAVRVLEHAGRRHGRCSTARCSWRR